MSAQAYQPVPACVAAQVSSQFGQDVVVILAFDTGHQSWHTTTFGWTAHDKVLAALAGEAAARAVGVDLDRRTVFEDFRSIDAARNAELVRRLVQGIEACAARNGGGIPEPLCDAYAAATQALVGGRP